MLSGMKTLVLFLLSAALTMAADMTGKWTFNVVLDAGGGSPTFDFKQAGEKLTGTYHGQLGEAPLEGTVKGDAVEFTINGGQLQAKYIGKIDGGTKIKGTVDYGELGKGTFDGSKN
jgi:hypothetical protein